MKIFLFLYPIAPYVECLIRDSARIFEQRKCSVDQLNNIITRRYRNKNFQIFWTYFSKDNDVGPDEAMHCGIIRMEASDRKISAGVSFSRHTTEKVYPDPEYVINQLPCPIEKLIIGGYHRSDCVDKIARYAYEKKIPAFVDEDTTEFFFVTTSLHGKIPPNRNIRIFPKSHLKWEGRWPSWVMMEHMIKHRKERPWLAQIRL